VGSLQAFGVGALGGAIFLFWSPATGRVVLGVAAIVLLAALVSPTGLYAGIRQLLLTLGRWTGQALTWALLVPLFYLVFLPFGWLFRRGSRDLLKRYFDPEAATYWEPHEGATAASESRQRQY
jgi:hypothetical protein